MAAARLIVAGDLCGDYERIFEDAYDVTNFNFFSPFIDVMLFWLGADGDTTSLFTGEPVLEEGKVWVAAVLLGRLQVRVTTTYPTIESSRRVATLLIIGGEKAEIFGWFRAGNSRVPTA